MRLAAAVLALALPAAAQTPTKTPNRFRMAAVMDSLMRRECDTALSLRGAQDYQEQVRALVPYVDAARSQAQLVFGQAGRLDAKDPAVRKDAQDWVSASRQALSCLRRMTEDDARPMDPDQADPRFGKTYFELVNRTSEALRRTGELFGDDLVQTAEDELRE